MTVSSNEWSITEDIKKLILLKVINNQGGVDRTFVGPNGKGNP